MASVLSDIIVGKFIYHLPFYRQIQQYRECGITISDSTMGGWYEAAVEKLKLLYDILRRQILSSEYVQVDESVIPVIDNEKHKARKGYEWCVRDGIWGMSCSGMTGAAVAITSPVKSWADTGETYNATAMRHMTSLKGCPG